MMAGQWKGSQRACWWCGGPPDERVMLRHRDTGRHLTVRLCSTCLSVPGNTAWRRSWTLVAPARMKVAA